MSFLSGWRSRVHPRRQQLSHGFPTSSGVNWRDHGIVRASRMMTLLLHLQARGQASGKDLARPPEVSERTVQRDVEDWNDWNGLIPMMNGA